MRAHDPNDELENLTITRTVEKYFLGEGKKSEVSAKLNSCTTHYICFELLFECLKAG